MNLNAPLHCTSNPPPPYPSSTPFPTAAPLEAQVEGKVDSLKRRFAQSGVQLPLEHLGGVGMGHVGGGARGGGRMYRLGASTLELSVRGGSLVVRVAEGYCDFLEYLSKASL